MSRWVRSSVSGRVSARVGSETASACRGSRPPAAAASGACAADRCSAPNRVGTSTQMSGGHAEYMLAFADATMLLPEGISYEQAAPIFCAGYTVWSGLRWADPKPGERVAVVGIGGLGHLAVQYAKAAGFETIAVSHSPDKDRLIRELGADAIVRDGESLGKAGGADVVLGTSNSADAMADAIKGLRPDGRLVVMGFEPKPLPLSIGDLIMRRIRVLGSQQNGREYLYEALKFVAEGKVKVLAETYALTDIAPGLRPGRGGAGPLSGRGHWLTLCQRRSRIDRKRTLPD